MSDIGSQASEACMGSNTPNIYMANISASARAQDTALFCGAVIRNVRENKTFSFQTLYTEVTGKKNPNKAYKLRDALVAIDAIRTHRDGTYYLVRKKYDAAEITEEILAYLQSLKDEPQGGDRPSLIADVEISPNPLRMEDEVLDGFQEPTPEPTPISVEEAKNLFIDACRRAGLSGTTIMVTI